jgi:hypothetical protein
MLAVVEFFPFARPLPEVESRCLQRSFTAIRSVNKKLSISIYRLASNFGSYQYGKATQNFQQNRGRMRTVQTNLMMINLMWTFALVGAAAPAQAPLPATFADTTRFTIAAAPLLSQPRGEFGQNVGDGFGGGGALLYRLDRTGWLSLRFDASGHAYGREEKRVPLSELLGPRVLVDVTTTNSLMSIAFGPELAFPRGPVRPYVNAAISGLFFKTSTSVDGSTTENQPVASTTNHSDNTRAWVLGTGLRIPLPRSDSRFSLDLGLRYHYGGVASYLREGSIQDTSDGSIIITPLNTRTPYIAYLIGVRFTIPFNSRGPCPRFLC